MTVCVDAASNMAVERPACSHSLAAAAHCRRYTDKKPVNSNTGMSLNKEVEVPSSGVMLGSRLEGLKSVSLSR